MQKPTIREDVDDHDRCREQELYLLREPRRVDDRKKVVLDEPLGIARFTRAIEKRVLNVSEWADTPGHLDEKPPCSRRQVCHDYPAPSQGQQRAEKYERDEREVNEQYRFRA